MASLDPRKLFSVEGLVVVITGGGSGIGLMVAKALSANNAKAVYIVGRRESSLQNAVSQCPNPNVHALVGDVTSKDSLQSIAERITAEQGHIDVLFANSGIGGPGVPFKKPALASGDVKPSLQEWRDALWSIPMEDFTQTLHVNCTGVMYTVLAFLPLLIKGNERRNPSERRQRSQILVTSSIAAWNRTIAHNPSYPASKAAVLNLVKTLSTKLAPEGIRVNCLAPGLYTSEMTAGHSAVKEGMEPDEDGALPADVAPEQRMGGLEDMAATALYVMGAGGAYLSGSVLMTDGGRSGQMPNSY